MTTWIGTVPTHDDFGNPIEDEFVDGKTIDGPWAIMVPEVHAGFGIGFGTGKGQRYQRNELKDGRSQWIKVEG